MVTLKNNKHPFLISKVNFFNFVFDKKPFTDENAWSCGSVCQTCSSLLILKLYLCIRKYFKYSESVSYINFLNMVII